MLVQGALTESDPDAHEATDAFPVPVLAGRDLTIVDAEVTRLEGLVRSFLDFARPPVPERRVVEICSLVEETLGLVAGRASAAGVAFALDCPARSMRVAIDPGQIRQVVLNLVLNALDTVKAGGRIEIGLKQDKDGVLTLRVADNGRGLPPELGARIFEPFITSKETGLGLGLSICKRIAEGHGGTIVGKNRSGGGAEFVVRLPAKDATHTPVGAVS
jgi:signal transduction histidine kinase